MTTQTRTAIGRIDASAAPVAGAGTAAGMPGAMLAVLGIAFLTMTMLAASIAPGYDYHGAAISDLGVIDETAGLFNGLLVLVGA